MSTETTTALGELLDVRKSAGYLGITETAMRQLIRMRRVRVLHLGRRLGCYAAWLDEYRATNTVEPTGNTRGALAPLPLEPLRPEDVKPRERWRAVPARLRAQGVGQKSGRIVKH
jgi:hypothetical protein